MQIKNPLVIIKNGGFKQVETIYDMNSTDANINWGYTGGIGSGTTITGKDFTKYKKLIGTYGDGGNFQWAVCVELSILFAAGGYRGGNSFSSTDAEFQSQMLSKFGDLRISADKTSLSTVSGYTYNGNTNGTETYKLCKVEGLY